MTPSQAATIIGCTPQHVRLMIRRGRIKAKAKTDDYGNKRYDVSKSEAEKFRDNDSTLRGRPRKYS